MKSIRRVIFCATCTALFPLLLHGGSIDFYVDPVNGNDANDGLSWETSLKTVTAASSRGDPDDSLTIRMSEGVFCPESGEIFPLSFDRPADLIGASKDMTFIDPGTSPAILSCTYQWADCSLSNVTFLGTEMLEDAGDGGAMIRIESTRWVEMVSVDFINLRSNSTPILQLGAYQSGPFLDLEDCAFVDCDAMWLSEDGNYIKLDRMIRCTFQKSFLTVPEDCTPFSWAMISHSTFIGPGRMDIVCSLGIAQLLNCSFEDFDLRLLTREPVAYTFKAIFQCSFRNATVELGFPGGGEIEASAFDARSDINMAFGWARVYDCCIPFTLDENISGAPIAYDPLFSKEPWAGAISQIINPVSCIPAAASTSPRDQFLFSRGLQREQMASLMSRLTTSATITRVFLHLRQRWKSERTSLSMSPGRR